MEFEFSGQHDKATYFRAIRWIYKPSRRDLIIRIAAFVAFLVLYVALIATAVKEDVSISESARIFRHFLTFLILAYFLFQPYIKSYQTASRLWQDPLIQRKINGRISTIGIQIAPSNDWMAWDQFVKVYKSEDVVVLLTAARLFVILPRNFFRDDNDWKMLQSFIASKVKQVIE